MNRRSLFLAVGLVLFAHAAAFAQLNKFEGKSIVVDAAENGGSCAVSYGGDPTISALSGATVPIYDCAGNFLHDTPHTIPRDQNSGYWCFQGTLDSYKITFPYGLGNPAPKVSYLYWPAKNKSSGFYNVKDFGALGDGVTDDTRSIKNAVAFVAAQQGGTLYFPAGQYIVGDLSGYTPITLPSGIVIQGVSGMPKDALHNYFEAKQYSQIRLKGSARSLFRIGECTTDVKIRDVALFADSNQGTYGLEALGKVTPTIFVGLENVSVSRFDIGVYAHNVGGGSWQFDYVKLSHDNFAYNRTAGVKIDMFNTDWTISDTVFLNPGGNQNDAADSIRVVNGGSMTVENTWGGGLDYGPNLTGGDFIDVTNIGALTIIKSGSERSGAALRYGDAPGAGQNSAMLTLINNTFGDPVLLRARATFISTGNLYLGNNVETMALVKVYSTGDRFCYDAVTAYFPAQNPAATRWPCGDQGPTQTLTTGGFQGSGQIVFESGQLRDYYGGSGGGDPARVVEGRPTRFGTDMVINSDGDYPANSGLSILSSDPLKPLLRLGGGSGNTYNLQRDADGGLLFTGAEAPGLRSFRFDAPVGLPSMEADDLPRDAPDGSMAYCSNCQRDTAPCKSAGRGAPATKIAGNWECK